MAERPVKSPTEARSGSIEGVARYVLVISTVLVVILFALSYVIS
jgi:hypothetical protein